METFRDCVDILFEHENSSDEQQVDHQPEESRVRVKVTLLIALVTVLTAVAGYLAARADGRAVAAERHQQAAALASRDAESAYWSATTAIGAESVEAESSFYRAAASSTLGDNLEKDTWLQKARDEDSHIKSEWQARPLRAQFNTYERTQEKSDVWGESAYDWRRKQHSFIGVAALGAIGLFLLGLVLTIPHRRVASGRHPERAKKLLLISGAAIPLAGVVWLVLASLSPVSHMSASTLDHYVTAQRIVQFNQFDPQSTAHAEALLRSVVQDRPKTPDAWYALGSDLSSSGQFPTQHQLREAEAAYKHALHAGASVVQPFAWNNLAFDELLAGDTAAARRDIKQALENYGGNKLSLATAQGTEAEILLRSGKQQLALDELDAAVRTLDGAAANNLTVIAKWFDALRNDWLFFSHEHRADQKVNDFYKVAIELEALLEDNAYKQQPVPANIANLQVAYQDLAAGQMSSGDVPTGLLHISFDYANFVGSRFSMRTYEIAGDEYVPQLGASLLKSSAWTWGTDTGHWNRPWPVTVEPNDRYLVEVYWNDQLLGSKCLQANIDGSQLNPATGCDPLT